MHRYQRTHVDIPNRCLTPKLGIAGFGALSCKDILTYVRGSDMSAVPHRLPRRLPLALIVSSIFCAAASDTACALTLLVTDCSDGSSSGTLRNTIAAAPDNSIIQIPLMCSKITLDQGRIAVSPTITNMYIVGQSPSATIIEGPATNPPTPLGRLFFGQQQGTLGFSQLTLQKGVYFGTENAAGGCVYSSHSVAFNHAVVTGCVVNPSGSSLDSSRGGAIYARYAVTLLDSEVSNSRAYGPPGKNSNGGGVFAGDGLYATSSTISGNSALSGFGGSASHGGGFFSSALGSTVLTRSTISNNEADVNSAGEARTESGTHLTISSSTIANNHAFASQAFGSYVPTTITNSTIAENTAAIGGSSSPAGLYSALAITMNNSIFANNVAATGLSIDVYSNSTTLTGSNNLITATFNSVPIGTLSSCPKLGHLSSNGGLTKTIPLLKGSPALDAGAANGQTTDQRGTGFPRTVGSGTDIGAYERQAGVVDDVIFFGQFEGRCE